MRDESRRLLRVQLGSHLYGTAVEGSDHDWGEVYLETPEELLGAETVGRRKQTIQDGQDVRRHGLRHFVSMLLTGNPNVVEWLFAPQPEFGAWGAAGTQTSHLWCQLPRILGARACARAHLGFARGAYRRVWKKPWEAPHRKTAAHAYRVLAQLRELLTTGEIRFPLHGCIRGRVLDIRNGVANRGAFMLIYDQAESALSRIDKKQCALPYEADRALANTLLIEFYTEYVIWTRSTIS